MYIFALGGTGQELPHVVYQALADFGRPPAGGRRLGADALVAVDLPREVRGFADAVGVQDSIPPRGSTKRAAEYSASWQTPKGKSARPLSIGLTRPSGPRSNGPWWPALTSVTSPLAGTSSTATILMKWSCGKRLARARFRWRIMSAVCVTKPAGWNGPPGPAGRRASRPSARGR